MEVGQASYSDILNSLKDVTKKRDPRALRLAAVTSAIVEVVAAEDGGDSRVSAAKVFAKAVPALEGTFRKSAEGGGRGGDDDISDSLSTQVALLELLEVTVPHVTPPVIISATLVLTSRVLRAMIESVRDAANAAATSQNSTLLETTDELGRVNAVLRRTCRVSTEVLRRVGTSANEQIVKELLTGTILTLFQDRRPKVRKAAHGSTIELLSMGEEEPTPTARSSSCHVVIRRTVTQFAHNQLSSARRYRHQNEQLRDVLHLLGFLEQAIFYLNYSKLGNDMMELFAALIEGENASTATSNFVAVVKVQEATPKVLAVSAILSTITVMLKDFSRTIDRKRALDEFAPRVLASLLPASLSLIFRSGVAEFDLLQRGRTLYGQAVLASCDRVSTLR